MIFRTYNPGISTLGNLGGCNWLMSTNIDKVSITLNLQKVRRSGDACFFAACEHCVWRADSTPRASICCREALQVVGFTAGYIWISN